MTTKEFITMMREEVGTSYTRQRLLEFTNRAQNEILGEDSLVTRVKPDPFLTTVADTFTYTATSSIFDSTTGAKGSASGDIRAVRKIYSFSNEVSIFDFQTLDPASDKPNQFESMPTTDVVTARADVIDSIEPASSDCVIKWWEGNDPGGTTVVWRCEAHKWPTQLTSESIALSLPADFQNSLLVYGILKNLQRREYGRSDDALEKWGFYRKKFRTKYNRMATQDLRTCTVRDF